MKLTHLLQAPILILECVTQAQTNDYVEAHVQVLASQLGYRITQFRLKSWLRAGIVGGLWRAILALDLSTSLSFRLGPTWWSVILCPLFAGGQKMLRSSCS